MHVVSKQEEVENNNDQSNVNVNIKPTFILKLTISSIMTSTSLVVTRAVKLNYSSVLPDGDGLVYRRADTWMFGLADGGVDACMI